METDVKAISSFLLDPRISHHWRFTTTATDRLTAVHPSIQSSWSVSLLALIKWLIFIGLWFSNLRSQLNRAINFSKHFPFSRAVEHFYITDPLVVINCASIYDFYFPLIMREHDREIWRSPIGRRRQLVSAFMNTEDMQIRKPVSGDCPHGLIKLWRSISSVQLSIKQCANGKVMVGFWWICMLIYSVHFARHCRHW